MSRDVQCPPRQAGRPTLSVVSADAYLKWPAVPNQWAAAQLSLQFQLQASQWWTLEQLTQHQFSQLHTMVEHAFRFAPFYRKRLKKVGYNIGKKVTAELWSNIPVLSRRDIQEAKNDLNSTWIPEQHGRATETKSSGSTGVPVRVLKTDLNDHYWQAITLRDHLWHGRDLSGILCAIRDTESILGIGGGEKAKYPHGISWKDWGGAAGQVFATGPSAALHIHTGIAEQVKWLRRRKATNLITFPSNLHALATYCAEEKIDIDTLKDVSTLGEVMTANIREAVMEAWGIPVRDMYSSAEVGYIALQCPETENYHLQSEVAYVEILDDDGRPCEPGQTGRVIVTPLHNLATPLIRYEVGDHAVVGAPCDCGRGLPVITRVLGRTRNMLYLPNGEQVWPELEGGTFTEVAPVQQFQVIQKTLERLEVRLVTRRPMEPGEEDALRRMIQMRLKYPFDIAFTYHDVIERSRSGKYEDFKSEVTPRMPNAAAHDGAAA